MPYVQGLTNRPVSFDNVQAWKSGVARALAEVAGKPEPYLFVSLQSPAPSSPEIALFVGGQDTPGAVVRVSLIGELSRAQKEELTRRLCDLCRQHFGVLGTGVYVIMEAVAAENWGWNGQLFG